MKNHSLLFLLFSLLICACSDNNPAAEQPQQGMEPAAKANPQPDKNAVPPLSSLTKHTGSTDFSIDRINGELVGAGPMVLKPKPIVITGWAIDKNAGQLSGGVYVTVDGKPYPARHLVPRPDVAKLLNNPVYTNAGFTATVPYRSLSKGVHKVGIRVVNHAKNQFYEIPPTRLVSIEVK